MNHRNVVELVERAVRAEPHCSACGSPTSVESRESGLWLACTAPGRSGSILRRLVTLGDIAYAHTSRLLLDAEAIEPAA